MTWAGAEWTGPAPPGKQRHRTDVRHPSSIGTPHGGGMPTIPSALPQSGQLTAAAPLDSSRGATNAPALHDQVVVGQLLGKVVYCSHKRPCCPGRPTADDTANVFDDAGLMPSVGSSSTSNRARPPGLGNGQLLLLPARQVTAPAVQHLFQHREQLKQLWRGVLAGLWAKPMCRFSCTVRRAKISRPCGTNPMPARARS